MVVAQLQDPSQLARYVAGQQLVSAVQLSFTNVPMMQFFETRGVSLKHFKGLGSCNVTCLVTAAAGTHEGYDCPDLLVGREAIGRGRRA